MKRKAPMVPTFAAGMLFLATALASPGCGDSGSAIDNDSGTNDASTIPVDNDQDGYNSDVDCDDNNPDVYPGVARDCQSDCDDGWELCLASGSWTECNARTDCTSAVPINPEQSSSATTLSDTSYRSSPRITQGDRRVVKQRRESSPDDPILWIIHPAVVQRREQRPISLNLSNCRLQKHRSRCSQLTPGSYGRRRLKHQYRFCFDPEPTNSQPCAPNLVNLRVRSVLLSIFSSA